MLELQQELWRFFFQFLKITRRTPPGDDTAPSDIIKPRQTWALRNPSLNLMEDEDVQTAVPKIKCPRSLGTNSKNQRGRGRHKPIIAYFEWLSIRQEI
jgi:hypothetical protein